MQARLQTRQFPTGAAAAAFALAVLGSGLVGYTLKATTIVSGPTRIVQAPAVQSAPAPDDCIRADSLKAC